MSAIEQIEDLFDTLDRENQLLVMEKLARQMRLGKLDKEAFAREMMEMANEPGLNAPYPLPEDLCMDDQLVPRGFDEPR